MKFHLGPPPHNPEFDPDVEGWTQVRTLGPFMIQIIAFPIATVIFLLCSGLLTFKYPGWLLLHVERSPSVILFLLLSLCIMPVHELLHLVMFPKGLRSERTILGFWPSRLLPYAFFSGELDRNRLLIVYLTPLTVMSIIPLLLIGWFEWPFFEVALCAMINAAASTGDLIGSTTIVSQVPHSAVVRAKGWTWYWKLNEEVTPA